MNRKLIFVLAMSLGCHTMASAQNVYNFAGTSFGDAGDYGPAVFAQLKAPSGIAADKKGNIYISDIQSCKIRKVDKNGIITTIGGVNSCGPFYGPKAIQSQFNSPESIASDSIGQIFVSDRLNNKICFIDTANNLTVIAGTGVSGFGGDGGPATAAMLKSPYGIVRDNLGNLYIADDSNCRIRKINPSGIITTIAGTGVPGYSGDGGPAIAAQLFYPTDITVDHAGNVYFRDYKFHIRKIDPQGIITTVAGTGVGGTTGDGGPALQATIFHLGGLARDMDETGMWIGDGFRVRKIQSNDTIKAVAGTGVPGSTGDGGPALQATFSNPRGVFIDPYGNLLVADYNNTRVRIVCYDTLSPVLNITATPGNNVCANQAITFIAGTQNGGPFPEYQWLLNGLPVGTNSITYTHSLPANGDVIKCVVTNYSKCISVPRDTSNSITVTLSPLLTPSVTITANPSTNVLPNQYIGFTATAINAGPNPKYQWTKNTVNIPGATQQTYTTNALQTNNVIACRVTSDGTCPDSSLSNQLIINVLTGINPVNGTEYELSIYPNPAGDILNMDHKNFTAGRIMITDLMGKVLFTKSFSSPAGRETFNIRSLAAGVYLYSVLESDMAVQQGRLIKK